MLRILYEFYPVFSPRISWKIDRKPEGVDKRKHAHTSEGTNNVDHIINNHLRNILELPEYICTYVVATYVRTYVHAYIRLVHLAFLVNEKERA